MFNILQPSWISSSTMLLNRTAKAVVNVPAAGGNPILHPRRFRAQGLNPKSTGCEPPAHRSRVGVGAAADGSKPSQAREVESQPPSDARDIAEMLEATQKNIHEAQEIKSDEGQASSRGSPRTSMSYADAKRAQHRARRVLAQAEAACAVSPEHSSTHQGNQAPGKQDAEEPLGRKEYLERAAEGTGRSLTPDTSASKSWAEEEAFYAQGGHGFSAGKRREAPAGVDATIASRIVGSGSYGGTYSSSEVDEADREAVLRELAELVDGSGWGRVSGGGSTTPVMAYEEVAERLREVFPTSKERQQQRARTASAPQLSDQPGEDRGARQEEPGQG